MFFHYLIISKHYYDTMDNKAANRLQQRLNDICKYAKRRHIQIHFACFRYANTGILNHYECQTLITFLHVCYQYNIIPLINFSMYKIEILYALYVCGFYVGLHFKEADMALLQNNICHTLKQDYHITTTTPTITLWHSRYFHNKKYDSYEAFYNVWTTLYHLKLQFDYHWHTSHISIAMNHNNKQSHTMQPIFFYSSHNLVDLEKACNYNIDYVTISPIFYDKGNKALGVHFLHTMPQHLKKRAFALGGVNHDKRIMQIKKSGVAGFASIGYFINGIKQDSE